MRRRKNSGYTLIEALVAAIILVIVLPFLTRWVLAGRQSQTGSLRADRATAVAAWAIDSLSQLPRAARTPHPTPITVQVDGMDYSLAWNWLSTSAYASTELRPGAVYVEVSSTKLGVTRKARLEGVLP